MIRKLIPFLITLALLTTTGCSCNKVIRKTSWSTVLKEEPQKIQEKQKELQQAFDKLKNRSNETE